MAIRFFKKFEPLNSPVLANGSKCTFTTLNHAIGYFATDNPYIHGEFERLMTEGRYGMSEISAEEFTADYLEPKKKLGGTPLKKPWREEIQAGPFSSETTTPSVPRPGSVAVAVESADTEQLAAKAVPVAAAAVADVAQVPTMTTPAEFKPPTAKRAKMKKKQ